MAGVPGALPQAIMYCPFGAEQNTFVHTTHARRNPFDLTKLWPHARFPLIEVGILELNRKPENCFAEVEQASFSPSATVPGISRSPDKLLPHGGESLVCGRAVAPRVQLDAFIATGRSRLRLARWERDESNPTSKHRGHGRRLPI